MGGRAGAHPSQGEHRVSRVRLDPGNVEHQLDGAALQQTLSSPAAAWTSWCSSPPGRVPSLSGTSGPRKRRAPARWAALQQTPCSPAVRLDELVLIPPRASTKSLGYVWPPGTSSRSEERRV